MIWIFKYLFVLPLNNQAYKMSGTEQEEQNKIIAGYHITKLGVNLELKQLNRIAKAIINPKFPLPYNGELNTELCYGIALNDALFTQCQELPTVGVYCPKCAKQCTKTDHGKPLYGTIQDRQKVGIMDYVDPKNRTPVEYVKVMNKYKVSRQEVEEEASRFGMIIDPVHFEMPVKKLARVDR